MQRLALITGAAGGIGFAAAEQMAKAGYKVVLTDLDAASVAARLDGLDGSGHAAYPLDVTNEPAIEQLFAKVEAEHGPISVLGHFAGILDGASSVDGVTIEDVPTDAWRHTFEVNALGTFLCVREMARCRRTVPVAHGRIITVSSLAGQMGGNIAGLSYAASKGAVMSLTKNAARQLARAGITVNCIAPGGTDTPMYRGAAGLQEGENVQNGAGAVPMGRVGTPAEIASLAVYLASEGAAYLTGQVIGVNGGIYT